jgi:hypothetical protein
MKKSYGELLRDPRWQRKRLEALNAADFACEQCEDKTSTLNVHHKLYRKGAMPWDYESHELKVLCETCHKAEHMIRDELAEVMSQMDSGQIDRLLGYAHGILLIDGGIARTKLISFEHAMGVHNAASPCDAMVVYRLLERTAETHVITSEIANDYFKEQYKASQPDTH